MMEYLGKGRMRKAYRIGGIVIKIPYTIQGVRACFEELILWMKHHSPAMAPVLFAIPGLCVAMPYYGDEFTGDRPKAFKEMLNAFGIVDLHAYNVRNHKGNPIAIDYAINANSSGQGTPTDE
jgi:inhibitor of KinA sporulation pathway (predicted exonuclease)